MMDAIPHTEEVSVTDAEGRRDGFAVTREVAECRGSPFTRLLGAQAALSGPIIGRSKTMLDVLSVVTKVAARDRKSTRLNSSHSQISYAVFCLKKKNAWLTPNVRRSD